MATTSTLWFSSFVIVLVVCLFSGFTADESTSKRTYVSSLPGLDGPLPSRLETGYVTVDEENGAELFYYFVESEGDPGRDPVLLWLTGGKRCSVLSGFFFEIGPVKFVREPYDGGGLPRLRRNAYSWTKVANILFVESPVGAGFSFSRDPRGYDVGDASASLQLVKFLSKWFSEHQDYLANPFHIGGDSYAGKIVPIVTQMISEDIEAGLWPILNLKGYMVGNPITGDAIDYKSRVPFAHGFGIISDQLYETIMMHCDGKGYNKPMNSICAQALSKFSELLDEVSLFHILYDKCIYVSPGRKVLNDQVDILNHPPSRPPIECLIEYLSYLLYFWANNNATRESLGIKKGTVNEFVRCNYDLPYSEDVTSSIKYHHNVTSKNYRALVYSGDHDAVAPFLGTQAWVRSLNDSVVDEWRAWHLDGESAGVVDTMQQHISRRDALPCSGVGFPTDHFDNCIFSMYSSYLASIMVDSVTTSWLKNLCAASINRLCINKRMCLLGLIPC